MSFGQAFKMAFKSLGSKKLRTFLTMLGVIIGVSCVALLSTVTSGAKDYIVGTLKEESQLVNMMMMSQNKILTRSELDKVASSVKKDITGEFTYCGVSQGSGFAKVNGDFVNIPKTEKQSEDQQVIYRTDRILGTGVVATDPNYADVRTIDLVGRFFGEGEHDKCTINQEFLTTYYPTGTTAESVLGTTIELFAEANLTQIKIGLPSGADAALVEDIFGLIINSKIEGVLVFDGAIEGVEQTDAGYALADNWFENYSGKYLQKIDDMWCVVFDVDSISITSEELAQILSGTFAFKSQMCLAASDTKGQETWQAISQAVTASAKEASNSKVFTIVGVIVQESSLVNSMGDSSFITQPNLVEIMKHMNKGNVGVLLTDENMKFITYGTRNLKTAGDKTAAELSPSEYDEVKYASAENAPISFGLFRFDDEDKVEAGASQIMSAMVTRGFMPDSFLVISMNTIAGMVSTVMNILTIMLSVIAGISLVVGGIGIMNIMLVTVSERTREIGIRKAIGAKKSSILLQFLIEALVVTMLGGLIGIIISLLGTLLLGKIMGITLLMPAWVFAISLGFSIAIGVIFGMYPAVKAARMHPIDALRHD